jgi:hypothetical protein
VLQVRGDEQLGRLLGLAWRAGKLLLGIEALRPLAERNRELRILASPTLSARGLRELERLADRHPRAQAALLADFEDRIAPLGKRGVKVVAVSDDGFRRGLDRYFVQNNSGEQGGCH